MFTNKYWKINNERGTPLHNTAHYLYWKCFSSRKSLFYPQTLLVLAGLGWAGLGTYRWWRGAPALQWAGWRDPVWHSCSSYQGDSSRTFCHLLLEVWRSGVSQTRHHNWAVSSSHRETGGGDWWLGSHLVLYSLPPPPPPTHLPSPPNTYLQPAHCSTLYITYNITTAQRWREGEICHTNTSVSSTECIE